MRVKCLAETVPAEWRQAVAVSPTIDSRRTYGVAVGQTYVVLGLEFRGGLPWVQIEVGPDELISVPTLLFEIVDPTVPDAWEARVLDAGDLVLWPSAFFSPGFHERLFEGDPTAKSALDRIREQVDRT